MQNDITFCIGGLCFPFVLFLSKLEGPHIPDSGAIYWVNWVVRPRGLFDRAGKVLARIFFSCACVETFKSRAATEQSILEGDARRSFHIFCLYSFKKPLGAWEWKGEPYKSWCPKLNFIFRTQNSVTHSVSAQKNNPYLQ